jgi:hypothetical protein
MECNGTRKFDEAMTGEATLVRDSCQLLYQARLAPRIRASLASHNSTCVHPYGCLSARNYVCVCVCVCVCVHHHVCPVLMCAKD